MRLPCASASESNEVNANEAQAVPDAATKADLALSFTLGRAFGHREFPSKLTLLQVVSPAADPRTRTTHAGVRDCGLRKN